MTDELGHVHDFITRRLVKGKRVPVLGAGVNLEKRPQPSFERGRCLPSGLELADELARYLGDVQIKGRDLARVSQYVAALAGEGPLEDESEPYELVTYIARVDTTSLFPVTLAAKLRESHFLFLGYSLRDWNLRVILYRLWGEQDGKTFKSWAIQKDPDPVDQAAWDERGVDILSASVEDFVSALEQRLPTPCVERPAPLKM